MSTTLTPILTKFWDDPQSWTLATYEKNEGYQALKKALGMKPADLVQMTKDSGLRGRGGAGFPTGMKWGFLPPRLQPRLHLPARRGRPRLPPPAARGGGGVRRRLPRQEHPGQRLRPRRDRPRRRGRLHLRRGDGAARQPRGPSRATPP